VIYGLMAIGVVLCALWLWANVLLVRGGESRPGEAKEGGQRQKGTGHPQTGEVAHSARHQALADAGEKPHVALQPETAASSADTENGDLIQLDRRRVHDVVEAGHAIVSVSGADQRNLSDSTMQVHSAEGPTAAHSADDADTGESRIEVLPQAESRRSVFEHKEYPFQLYAADVPMFVEEAWKRAFTRLTEDPRILGWIAFHRERVGAADRDYDEGLRKVLCDYRRAAERLRAEVGLPRLSETSISAEEGKVWILSAADDAWLALFVEADVDAPELSRRLLAEVHQA
jgi:hypothetical protein